MAVVAMTACDPQTDDDHSLGTPDTISGDQITFSHSPTSSASENVLTFTNTMDTKTPYSFIWDFGNGSTSKDKSVEASYPFAGDYTVVLTVYTADGSTNTKSEVIHIENDDYSLLTTPMYTALTGGIESTTGKTWVFDRTNNGHFGVGPTDADSPSWWSCPAEGKAECSLYNQEFTFKLSAATGLTLTWTNQGKIYTNEPGRAALAALGYTNSSVPPAGDFDVVYTPKTSYSFMLNETAKTLTLGDNAFFGHYIGVSSYTIVTLSDEELYVKATSAFETGSVWWYRFVPSNK